MNGEIVKQETGSQITPDNEQGIARTTAQAVAEIQTMIILAKRFPRDYKTCWQNLQEACMRPSLAQKALYSYPRGGGTIIGTSVNLARVAGQKYGNIRSDTEILRDDEDSRTIRSWAWDLETNYQVSIQNTFKKLIQRKVKGPDGKVLGTDWVKPDERDLLELNNRLAAKGERNCLLKIMPYDYIEDAVLQVKKTLKLEIKDPNLEMKRLVSKLTEMRIPVEWVNTYLGHQKWTTEDMVELQGILHAIQSGEARVSEYFGMDNTGEIAKDTLNLNQMTAGDPATHKDHQPAESSPRQRRERSDKGVPRGPRKEQPSSPSDTDTDPTNPGKSPMFAGQRELIYQKMRVAGITDALTLMTLSSEAAGLAAVRPSFENWTHEEAARAINNIDRVISKHRTGESE